jgi:hypothetical protein
MLSLFKKSSPALPEPEVITLDELSVEVAIVRAARKRSSSIEIRDNAVIIRVPKRMRLDEIRGVLLEKANWINKKLAEQAKRPTAPKRVFEDGSSFPFMGQDYTLKIIEGAKNNIQIEGNSLVLTLRNIKKITDLPARVKRTVRKWYMSEALALLTEKTTTIANQIEAKAGTVTIRDFKSRWGGCHPSGNIHYNWRIVMGPEDLVNYLVAHEVSHLNHHNHSPAFWDEVWFIMPDYKDWRNWLRDNSKLLSFE